MSSSTYDVYDLMPDENKTGDLKYVSLIYYYFISSSQRLSIDCYMNLYFIWSLTLLFDIIMSYNQ